MPTAKQSGKPSPGDPSLRLVAGDDGAAHVNRRMASRDWWLFVTCDPAGTAFRDHLERTHYAGKASEDFELLLMPALAEELRALGLL